MIVEAGNLALWTALLVVTYVLLASVLGIWRRHPALVISARYGFYTVPFLLSISVGALLYAFVTHDFSVKYVAENSNLAMQTQYTWVAFYAGNAGSLLFIALTFSCVAALAIWSISKRLPQITPYSTMLMATVVVFFLGVMVFLSNPLERLLTPLPDGQGINPLLVHFGMFIHPPMQMIGLVSVAIPFSIGLGALLSNRGGVDDWVDLGRIWGMISWLILTIGLILGSWWAYTILGWGGYWAWDPVENSALMPWLAMTAFVHSIMVQKRRGIFRMWNIILIVVAFTLAQMGMFINRGGPVPSVHSFAQSAMGWLFLLFMTITLLGSLAAFWWKLDTLRSRGNIESWFSRESAFLAQNALFLTVALVTLWGTVYPVLADLSSDVAVTVGEPFFNRINGPILLAIVFLMAIGPLLPWRRSNIRVVFSALRLPLGGAALIIAGLVAIGIRDVIPIMGLSVCGMTVVGIMHEWVRGTRTRHKNGENYLIAFARLLMANRPRYGGYIVHLAISMVAIGAIGSSFYSVQRDFPLKIGESATLGRYTFRYINFDETKYPDRDEVKAEFDVSVGGKKISTMESRRDFYHNFRIGATRAAIRSTPIEDFYIVPSEFSDDGGAVFRIYVNPLVWWMWSSGPLFVLGAVLAISPSRGHRKSTVEIREYDQLARA